MVVTDSLNLIFPCDVFVGVSDRIQCHCFLPGRRRRLKSLLISIYKTAGYCLDDCFASCENIIWISFKRMYGKLLSLPPPRPPEREVAADSRANNSAATHDISGSRSGLEDAEAVGWMFSWVAFNNSWVNISINFHVKREPHKLISAMKQKQFTAVTLKLKDRAILWTKNSKKKFFHLNIIFWM